VRRRKKLTQRFFYFQRRSPKLYHDHGFKTMMSELWSKRLGCRPYWANSTRFKLVEGCAN